MMGGSATPSDALLRVGGEFGARELGKYLLFVKLGSGGQADVFLAVEHGPSAMRRLVVVKRMRDDLAAHSDIVEMFLDEARLSTRLAHPNIVHTYEVGEAGGAFFIAMEYLEGQALEAVLRSRSPHAAVFTQRMWAAIAAEALAGLHYAHELRDYDGKPLEIVHRDISPHNVFLTYDGEVKLVDFGIAKATLNTLRTETGVLKGKLTYMAPEQTQGHADRRADLFTMGIILWEAMTGRRLFRGEPLAVLNSLLNVSIPAVSAENPSIDPRFEAIIARALEKDPGARFQTAEEMREALDAFLRATGDPIRKADIGRAVTTMFQPVHDSVKAQIQSYMANLVPSMASMGASRDRAMAWREEAALPELRTERSSSGRGDAYRSDPSLGSFHTRTRTVDPARRPWVAAVSIVVAVALGALFAAVLLRTRGLGPFAPSAKGKTELAPGQSDVRGTATLRLDSDPPEALVRWEGKSVGRTPLRVDLPSGPQALTLSRDGYYDETLVVLLPGGHAEPIVRVVTLRPKAPASAIAPSAPASPPLARPAPKAARPSPAPALTPVASTPPTAAPPPPPPPPLAPKDSW